MKAREEAMKRENPTISSIQLMFRLAEEWKALSPAEKEVYHKMVKDESVRRKTERGVIVTIPEKKRRKSHKQIKVSGRCEKFGAYVYRVLKQVHPDLEITRKSMEVMESLVKDMFERIASEASALTRHGKTRTLRSLEVQTAVKLLFPNELCKHAVAEGAKAFVKYSKSK